MIVIFFIYEELQLAESMVLLSQQYSFNENNIY